MTAPTFTDILSAKRTVSRYLPRTPLVNYPALDKICDTRILVKHENQQLTGAFKVRGGINLISQLSYEEREPGVITASTGNHGQSVAYAARLFGTRATIVVPETSNPLKVAAMQDLGAEVVFHGADFDIAREHCATLASREKMRLIHPANEPLLIAGVATIALEILEDAPLSPCRSAAAAEHPPLVWSPNSQSAHSGYRSSSRTCARGLQIVASARTSRRQNGSLRRRF